MKSKMKVAMSRFLREKQGDAFLGLMITLAILIPTVATLIMFYPVFHAESMLRMEAKQLMRTAETYGCVGDEVKSVEQSFVDNKVLKPDSISWDGTDFIPGTNKININDEIAVEVRYKMTIPVLAGLTRDQEPIKLTFDLRAHISGRSEVYYKEG